ncbi:MAG TPA: hypothetical protein VMS02_03360 [Solirubrobacteraceae bacterium]|nr:hypothetical protein [Solirubrobacteraceae bacterium]
MLLLSTLIWAPASAAGAGWRVNGTTLTGSEALSWYAQVDAQNVLKGAGVTITCSGASVNSEHLQIEASNKGSTTQLEFTGCSTTAPCAVGAKIATKPLTLEATLEGTLAVVATLAPKTGTLITTLEFAGTECSLAGTQPVSGHAKLLAPTGQDERTVQLVNEITTEASGELKIGSAAASLSGSELFTLTSCKGWSFL